MRILKVLSLSIVVITVFLSTAAAGDFDWIEDFNIRAEADPSGFKALLAARFHIGDLEIRTVLTNVERPSDAYMVFRMGEMSERPVDQVLEAYRAHRGKGWGIIAKSLGIKPGSREFHALKNSQDLYHDGYTSKGKSKGKGKGKHKGRK
ncbi:MAG: hypothetical protein JRH08_15455 [Deltaproteobacteria bacterium]|nr:hypothetical protein [Deltaproteobacteria bacterium]MBW1927673.1 hypothetical protein [Deltaproteobacteria bacterium]MBW2026336.1 hypothetical protein [Deltaproteobacteria bacterium]MBW2127026.1 hypothetical protein [Deltaproteobacteria bacterium]